jgi:exosome complex exonuclease DIS3/RRP44
MSHRNNSFLKRTKKGNVLKIVQEHYLRDDISCGYPECSSCVAVSGNRLLRSDAPHYIIVDTNIVLHSIEALEADLFRDVIFLETVLDEVKHHNLKVLLFSQSCNTSSSSPSTNHLIRPPSVLVPSFLMKSEIVTFLAMSIILELTLNASPPKHQMIAMYIFFQDFVALNRELMFCVSGSRHSQSRVVVLNALARNLQSAHYFAFGRSR